jgi:hypothetical protein
MKYHPCLKCGKPNKQWPYGLCTECEAEKKAEDARHQDILAESAYISYLASKLK